MKNNEINNKIEKAMFIGGHAYDIFMKSNVCNKASTPEQWKKFESDLVKYFYSVLGEDNPPVEVCNFTSFVNAFAESLIMCSKFEKIVETYNIDKKEK